MAAELIPMMTGSQAIDTCHPEIGWTCTVIQLSKELTSCNHGSVTLFNALTIDLTRLVFPPISLSIISRIVPLNGIQKVARTTYLNILAITAEISNLLKIFKSNVTPAGKILLIKDRFKTLIP